ncbi:MAG: glutamate racemase [Deltaproteobacteria bacterium]|nr:glutamate racemase [Deltaproteobacteria bacterium]
MAAREPGIGIFDSGVGGLTVVQRMIEALPGEHLVYLGDTARYPYGTKSAAVVSRYTLENAKFLLDTGVKLLVVACNTMSAVALDVLRAATDVPVVGVIEPGARAAVGTTRNRKIGVIGTEGTIASGSYTRALRAIDPELEIYTRACPLFVALAEEGWIDNAIAEQAAAMYLASLRQSRIDTLVLGCTHYPLLARTIGAYLGPEVQLVDSATETAREVAALLAARGLAAPSGPGSTSFFVTDVPDRFIRIGSRFLGSAVDSAVRIER